LSGKRVKLFTMPRIEIGNQPLFFAEHGKEQNHPALILLHGAGSSHLVWPGELRRLPAARVVALDLPGHGRSSAPGRRLIAHYAFSVREFIHELALLQPVLLGHSMGGAIALEIARSEPNLAGLIIMGAAAQMRVAPALLSGCLNDFDQTVDFIVANSFAAPSPAFIVKSRTEIKATGAVTTYGDFLACSRFDIRDELASISTPTLVIGGTADRMVPIRAVESLVRGLPFSRLEVLEGAGHFMMLEHRQEIARIVKAFLDDIRHRS